MQDLPEKDHIVFAFPDDGAFKRFHHFFPGDNAITCVKIRDGKKRIVKVKDGWYYGLLVDFYYQLKKRSETEKKKLKKEDIYI